MISAIAHPTDLSPEGNLAFEHALGLALVHRCRLDVLHVAEGGEAGDWSEFPQVRRTLARWGVLPAGAPVEAIYETTGVKVRKVDIHGADPVEGIARFLAEHSSNLIVMASHGRAGIDRILNSSVSAELLQTIRAPSLIFGPDARSIIDPSTGRIAVGSIVVPVDHSPDPNSAIDRLDKIVADWGATLDFVHVGNDPPILRDGSFGPRVVRALGGDVVESILAEAALADAIGMPMAGVQGLLDVLRGSTTERVVRAAPCPVLALPVIR